MKTSILAKTYFKFGVFFKCIMTKRGCVTQLKVVVATPVSD